MTIHTVTHNTLAHLRAVRHARRALAWSRVLPVGRILAPAESGRRVYTGRAY